jgi:hypothetical protein
MTQRPADVVRQIQSVRQLEAVVTAMRGIAASQAQKGRSLLSGIDAYSKVISRAIGRPRLPSGAPDSASSYFAPSRALPEPSANASWTRRQSMSAVQPAWSSGPAAQSSRTSEE